MPIQKTAANYINFIGGLDTESSVLNRNPANVTDIDNCVINDRGEIESRGGMEILEHPTDTLNIDVEYPVNIQAWSWEYFDTTNQTFQLFKIGDRVHVYKGNLTEVVNKDKVGEMYYTNSYDLFEYNTFIDLAFSGNAIFFCYQGSDKVSGEVTEDNLIVNINRHEIGSDGFLQQFGDVAYIRETTEINAVYDGSYAVDEFKVTDTVGSLVSKGTSIKINYTNKSSDYTIIKSKTDLGGGDYKLVVEDDTFDFETITTVEVSVVKQIYDILTKNTSCFFGLSRLIIAGFKNNPNRIYYSQIDNEDNTNNNKFYQEANPYDPLDSAAVATDGGYFDVKGANEIIGIQELSGAYIIFASNGIWAASGSEGIFRNDDYVVTKVSDMGCISKGSIIKVDNNIVYASRDGINILFRESSYTPINIQSLTDPKIKSLYTALPIVEKEKIKSTYDPIKKQILFLYSSTFNYNKVLVYNIKNKNWVKWNLKGNNLFIGDIFNTKYYSPTFEVIETDSGDEITTDSGEDVTVLSSSNQDEKYILGGIYHYYNNDGYIRWSYGRVQTEKVSDFKDTEFEEFNPASFTSAHQTYQDNLRNKNANYIKTIFEVIEDGVTTDKNGYYDPLGSCKLRVSYDFAKDPVYILDEFGNFRQTNNNYGKKQTVYPKYKNIKSLSGDITKGYSHVTSKNKVLGRGNVLQFTFFNEEIVRYFKALESNTDTAPILNIDSVWEEVDEEEYNTVGGSEWVDTTTYSIGDVVKVTKRTKFKLVGWSSELIIGGNTA